MRATFMSVWAVALLSSVGLSQPAPCGWVLWNHRTGGPAGPEVKETWSVTAGMPDFDACQDRALGSAFEKPITMDVNDQMQFTELVGGVRMFVKKATGLAIEIHDPVCLPAGVDPRPAGAR